MSVSLPFELIKELVEERIPFNKLLGLKLNFVEKGKVGVSLDFRDDLVGNYTAGVLHGGVIASVLDVVGGIAVMSTETSEMLGGMGTVDLRIDYLRPGSSPRYTALGEVVRAGRLLSTTRMEMAEEGGKLIAIGQAVYRMGIREDNSITL